MAEFGFNDHHENEVINYMRFARSKRGLSLKTIDSCFEELKESRLVEETFTVDEVREMLDGLQVVVRGEVEMELINTAHTNVLLLRQLFSQAEKFYLRLQSDISELENRELLEQVAHFEKTDFKTRDKMNQETSKPKLAPLNETGVSELLQKEISRLQEDNNKLKARLRSLESQAMSVLDEKTRAERALKDLRKVQDEQQMATQSKEINSLEDTVAALREDYERSLCANAASQKDLQENLISAKHELLRVHEQLALAEKAEFGFNDHHENEVINYMRFARSKRGLSLKTIDSCFEELKESRLVEETFTVDEVREMLDGLQVVVRGEVEMELINTAHTNVLLLRQLFSQAEKFYLRLQSDISELENRELLEQVAHFEKTDFKTRDKMNQETSKPKLAPLNETGVSELLQKEISRLQEDNNKLKARLRSLESQAMSVLDEKTRAERALKDLRKVQDEQQMATQSKEINSLEDTVAALREDYERSLCANAASQKDLQENLISAKHELLRVHEQLALAEKELDKKFQQTAAYRNMKEILTKKNEQIKEIRKRLQRYEPNE